MASLRAYEASFKIYNFIHLKFLLVALNIIKTKNNS